MAPRVRPAMQARRVRVSTVSLMARHGRVRVPVPPVPRDFLPDGHGRVVLPPGLRRRIRPEPVIDRSVARPQRGGSGRERRLRLMRLAREVPHDGHGHINNLVAVAEGLAGTFVHQWCVGKGCSGVQWKTRVGRRSISQGTHP